MVTRGTSASSSATGPHTCRTPAPARSPSGHQAAVLRSVGRRPERLVMGGRLWPRSDGEAVDLADLHHAVRDQALGGLDDRVLDRPRRPAEPLACLCGAVLGALAERAPERADAAV